MRQDRRRQRVDRRIPAARTLRARSLPDPDSITAGQFTAGRGRLDRVEGGYVLNGRFPFGSISNHADAIMSGAVVYENGAPVIGANGMPETRLAFARADQYVIEDTWRTHGLRGTGSNHYRAEDLFIPEAQAMLIDEALFKGREPLYSSGFNWVTTMAAVPLGIARRAMDEAKKLIAERQGGMPPRPMAELTFVRDAIAKVEMKRGSAHAFLFSSAEAFWAELEAGCAFGRDQGPAGAFQRQRLPHGGRRHAHAVRPDRRECDLRRLGDRTADPRCADAEPAYDRQPGASRALRRDDAGKSASFAAVLSTPRLM